MKICIIKLGADGDVLRTIPLAKAIKKKYKNSQITWITKGDIGELLKSVKEIDNVLSVPYYGPDKFDILYNFDIDKDALELVKKIDADEKYGFYDDSGFPSVFNSGASYYLDTLFDDELKKINKKTYQEMMFMVAELKYEKEKYEIKLENEDKNYAEEFARKNRLNRGKLIGIHMGASSRWPSKVWHKENVKELIRKANKKGYDILLFGGPNEVEEHELLVKELEKEKIKIHRNNPKNSKKGFASLVNLCKVMVCSDSFALHVAIALNKKTVGLFFCTSPSEVEGYDLLIKIIADKLEEFFPEKMDKYDEELVKSISVDKVLEAVEGAIGNK
ncbi:MAG: glycosyltransferase family 9 protein [Nanoarchaeota archaeon]